MHSVFEPTFLDLIYAKFYWLAGKVNYKMYLTITFNLSAFVFAQIIFTRQTQVCPIVSSTTMKKSNIAHTQSHELYLYKTYSSNCSCNSSRGINKENICVFSLLWIILGNATLHGCFQLSSHEDYWHHESHFSVIADIMPRKRFKLLRRFIHFNDNQQCDGSPDRFYKIRPLFEMLREQCLLIPST